MSARQKISKKLNTVTLQRALSKLGFCSRSEALKYIQSGKVAVNGLIVTNSHQWINIVDDSITVDGKPIEKKTFLYVLFNKPKGVITTKSDELGRKTIYNVLPDQFHHLKPVGRLDKDTSGLLLLTNDHRFAERITNPDSHIRKVYEVVTKKIMKKEQFQQLKRGVTITVDGKQHWSQPMTVTMPESDVLHITLDEGKNRQVRKMLECVGAEVKSLRRIAIGGLGLGQLKEGCWRYLTEKDFEKLFQT